MNIDFLHSRDLHVTTLELLLSSTLLYSTQVQYYATQTLLYSTQDYSWVVWVAWVFFAHTINILELL